VNGRVLRGHESIAIEESEFRPLLNSRVTPNVNRVRLAKRARLDNFAGGKSRRVSLDRGVEKGSQWFSSNQNRRRDLCDRRCRIFVLR